MPRPASDHAVWVALSQWVGRRAAGLQVPLPALSGGAASLLDSEAMVALGEWRPTGRDAQRVKGAATLLRDARSAKLDETQVMPEVHVLLAGDGVWATLRAFAEYGSAGPASPHLVWSSSPVSQWAQEGDQFTIYMDEAWPEAATQEGVIAGIVWWGIDPDESVLAAPPQHLRLVSPDPVRDARSYLRALAACPRAFPFVFRFRTVDGQPATQHYRSLIDQAILLLLGWMLPQEGARAEVRVVCEAYGAGSHDGADGTDHLRGVLAQARLQCPKRLSRWTLDRLSWRQKLRTHPSTQSPLERRQQGYMAYGDLLAYVTTFPKIAEVRAWLQPERLEGYLPIGLDITALLGRLDHLGETGSVGDVLQAVERLGHSRFFDRVVPQVKVRLGEDTELQASLLATLDTRYRAKDRDLRALGQLLRGVRNVLPSPPPPTDDDGARAAALWHIVAMQHANHAGDPVTAARHANAYRVIRQTLEDVDRDLVAFAEVLLAVHLADRFEFADALDVVNQLLSEPWFATIPRVRQGYAHSARGQYLAMLGDPHNATIEFDTALDLFDRATLTSTQRASERDQTGVYRAVNAIDAGQVNAEERVAALLAAAGHGTLEEAAHALAIDTGSGSAYRHHLLLRYAYHAGDERVWAAYSAGAVGWFHGEQHPWMLIQMYRALLCLSHEDEPAAIDAFDRALNIRTEGAGPTLALVRGLVATVATCNFDCEEYPVAATKALAVASILPSAAAAIVTLRQVLAAPRPESIPRALAALPFNYH